MAVDWSGRRSGETEAIWIAVAEAPSGRLLALENGFTRAAAIARVLDGVRDEPRTLVGLDFAFSFPRAFCERHGWRSGPDVWAAMAAEGEALLADPPPELFGRRGSRRPAFDVLRATERRAGGAPKSALQVGGAGAVGTGSIRGMPHLLTLRAAGVRIWPFDAPAWPVAVEVYPRLCTGPVVKTRWRERRAHLFALHGEQDPALLERAAGSEDAFDAACTAIVMAQAAPRPSDLAPGDPLEGEIWTPPRARRVSRPGAPPDAAG